MKGLDYNLKPFISQVMLESGITGNATETPGYVDLYTEQPYSDTKEKADEKIKLTFSLSLKGKYPTGLGGNPQAAAAANQATLEQITAAVNLNVIHMRRFTDKKKFQDFLLATNKGDFLKNLTAENNVPAMGVEIWGNSPHKDITKYVYYEDNAPIINIPLVFNDTYSHPVGTSPTFLAYAFAYESPVEGAIWSNNFAAEVIYNEAQVAVSYTHLTLPTKA